MELVVNLRFGMIFAGITMGVVITRVNSLELIDRLDYSSNGQIGSNATIGCDWVRGSSDNALSLYVITKSNKIFLTYFPAELSMINLIDFHTRLVVANATTALTMTITNITCSDIDIYVCRMQYFTDGETLEKNSTGRLVDIKIPPQVPVMTEQPSAAVSEGSIISFKCLANLGRPNKGQIVWEAYKIGQKIEYSFTTSVNETSNDNNCSVIVESKVTVQAKRKMQNITVACFSTNQDFKPTPALSCTSPSTDLCDQSQPLNILFSSNNPEDSHPTEPHTLGGEYINENTVIIIAAVVPTALIILICIIVVTVSTCEKMCQD